MKKIMLLFAAVLAIMLSSAMAEAAAPKDTWQPVTLRNRILGADFTFYLPEGEWIHLWSGMKFPKGEHTVPAPLGEPPVFYRTGSASAPLLARIRQTFPL